MESQNTRASILSKFDAIIGNAFIEFKKKVNKLDFDDDRYFFYESQLNDLNVLTANERYTVNAIQALRARFVANFKKESTRSVKIGNDLTLLTDFMTYLMFLEQLAVYRNILNHYEEICDDISEQETQKRYALIMEKILEKYQVNLRINNRLKEEQIKLKEFKGIKYFEIDDDSDLDFFNFCVENNFNIAEEIRIFISQNSKKNTNKEGIKKEINENLIFESNPIQKIDEAIVKVKPEYKPNDEIAPAFNTSEVGEINSGKQEVGVENKVKLISQNADDNNNQDNDEELQKLYVELIKAVALVYIVKEEEKMKKRPIPENTMREQDISKQILSLQLKNEETKKTAKHKIYDLNLFLLNKKILPNWNIRFHNNKSANELRSKHDEAVQLALLEDNFQSYKKIANSLINSYKAKTRDNVDISVLFNRLTVDPNKDLRSNIELAFTLREHLQSLQKDLPKTANYDYFYIASLKGKSQRHEELKGNLRNFNYYVLLSNLIKELDVAIEDMKIKDVKPQKRMF